MESDLAVSRFNEKVDRTGGPDACHPWLGAKNAKGCGNLMVNGRALLAHRFAWELEHGPVPDGWVVRRTCDNRACVNPGHVYAQPASEHRAERLEDSRPLKERFEEKVDRSAGPDGCHLWTGAVGRGGYGTIGVPGPDGTWRSDRAHRVALQFVHGPIPRGIYVCHRCDTPRCVNVAHLFLGTQHDNMRDMAAKGRGSRLKGEKSPRAKLTEADVAMIRSKHARGERQTELAAIYGVSQATVSGIVRGDSWSHSSDGPKEFRRKVSTTDEAAIRRGAQAGSSYRELADQHGVSMSTINAVINGRKPRKRKPPTSPTE